MTEQTTNNQLENKAKDSSPTNILDAISAVAAVGGGLASAITQNVIFSAIALPVSVGVHLFNRRQAMEIMAKHYQDMILQQNLHIVKTEEKLQTLSVTFSQFKEDSASNLLTLDQEHKTKLNELNELIKVLQGRADELEQSKGNLQEFTQSLEVQHQQLATVVDELCTLENYSQVLRSNPTAAEVYYQRGQSHQRLKDYQGAIEDYNQAINLDENYAKAYHSRGIAYAEINKRKLAVDDLRKAAKLYFEKAELDSYQQARDMAKKLYDLRDMMEETIQSVAIESPVEAGKTKVANAPRSVPVAKLFGDSESDKLGLFES